MIRDEDGLLNSETGVWGDYSTLAGMTPYENPSLNR
jgi:hypothetical protein